VGEGMPGGLVGQTRGHRFYFLVKFWF